METQPTVIMCPDCGLEYDPEYGECPSCNPGIFTRLARNRPLVILLVIAFLLLIVGPSLYYAFRPKPQPTRTRGIPVRYERMLPLSGHRHAG